MFSNRLREIRQENDIPQNVLAEAVEVSRQTIHAIESSKYTPSVELAMKIAEFLDLKVEDIFQLTRSRK